MERSRYERLGENKCIQYEDRKVNPSEQLAMAVAEVKLERDVKTERGGIEEEKHCCNRDRNLGSQYQHAETDSSQDQNQNLKKPKCGVVWSGWTARVAIFRG